MHVTRVLKYVAVLLLTGTAVVAASFYLRSSDEGQGPQYQTEPVTRGPVHRTVSSTGTLEALITVQIGSQASGQIKELFADYNSVVKKGQVLARLDPANYEAQRERAIAAVATSEAAVKNAEATRLNRTAELAASQANLEVARVTWDDAKRQEKRASELFADRLISDKETEAAQAAARQAEARVQQAAAQVSQAEAAINSAAAQLDQALANVKQTRAELASAEVNLEHTVIRAPIDGVVIERNVDIGQTVAAAFQAPVLFEIANDLQKMQVTAQVDEADIGLISEQAQVDFTVDAFPNEIFPGRICEIRLGSTSTTASSTAGVVVYHVIIEVDNPLLKLRPGMTATVDFTVATVPDGLRIVNSALRYSPQGLKADQSAESDPQPFDPTAEEATGKPIIAPSSLEQYGIKAGPKVRFPEAGAYKPIEGVVWVLNSAGVPEERRVRLGISNGRETALLAGDLGEGDHLVVRELTTVESEFSASSPFGPPRPRSGGR